MRIGIDISQVVYEGTGVSRFTKGLIGAILTYDRKNEWIFFFSSLRRNLDPRLEKEINSKGHRLLKWKLPPTLLSFLWNDLHQFSRLLPTPYTLHPDFFITSDWTEPPVKNTNKTTVIHDLVYCRYPETVDKKILRTQQKRLSWVKKESKLIFADSETTKKDLIDLLQIDEDRIIVNYPGVDTQNSTTSQIRQTLIKYKLQNKKFILTVGKLEPRKNLERLIKAFKLLNNKSIQLVIVGPEGWRSINNLKFQIPNLKLLGQVSDTELYSLYSSCLFFIFPSIWEGFGYPLVEAMKFAAPITCSNTSSMKEITDGAALFFNPLDINEMYQSIDRLIQDEKLRNSLIKKGLEKSKIFSWKNYYNIMINSFVSFPRRRESREKNYIDSGSSPE